MGICTLFLFCYKSDRNTTVNDSQTCGSIGDISHSQNTERKLFSTSVGIMTGSENIWYSCCLDFQQVSLDKDVSLMCVFNLRKVTYLR